MTDQLDEALESRIWSAISSVMDPEIGRPISELGFVTSVACQRGVAEIDVRLPTYFCSPNFAYLMVTDVRDAVTRVPGVTSICVQLLDHYASDEINDGARLGVPFEDLFEGEADSGLNPLRTIFARKAYLAEVDRFVRRCFADVALSTLLDLRIADLPECAETTRLLSRRADLGIAVEAAAKFLVDEYGHPVAPAHASAWSRRAHSTRVSMDGNAALCTGLLRTRYAFDELAATQSAS